MIYAAYTGRSVSELEWSPNIGDERRDYLQSKADEAVFDDDTFYPSRWDDPDSANPDDGPTAERSTAPRTVDNALWEILLLASIAWVSSM